MTEDAILLTANEYENGKKMDYVGWSWVVRGVGLIGGLLICVGQLRLQQNDAYLILVILGIILLIAAFMVACDKLRCPACKKRIPESLSVKYKCCPHCGAKLRKE